ncbi:MAG: outer membrane lipoprotein carrier protein LolA [Bacteroidales bacterium]|nr:outer membrane lipoprotein carrier protein LolA [Bacteroidales bacterium]MCL2133389.1 outer membrane lipoprotein carrier protein LolA [Bacteroidales bacterium]
MRRKTTYLLLLLLLPLCLHAQDSKTFLQTFVQKMSAQPVQFTFSFEYENLAQQIKESYEGTALCNSKQFRVLTAKVEVYCDGTTKWVYNVDVDEVMLFPASEAYDITDNPLLYIQQHVDDFKYKPTVQRKVEKGKSVLQLDMFPKDKNAAYISIGLTVDAATYYPVAIRYNLKDGQRYTVNVSAFDDKLAAKNSAFSFPKHKYPTAEVVDLR